MMALNPMVRQGSALDLELFDLLQERSDETELREMADVLGVPISLASCSPVHALRERVWNAFRNPLLMAHIGVTVRA